ncbi:MAG: fibronectin type III domain-containing protein, partial [Bacteroidales bacterium]|nr:fibronectin type III domain-containing protein [Bacteroidales bacterium]
TTLATCEAPSSLTDVSVTSSSINLSWTKGTDDQDAWQFRYKKTSETDYTYVLVENHPENTYTLTGLEPATSYYVNVRAWCGGDDYSKWSFANQTYDKSITTACGALTLPYFCDFEGAVETTGHYSSCPVPKCWDRIEYASGSYQVKYYPYIVSNDSPYNGSKCLKFYKYSGTADETIILPEIDDAYDMSSLQVRFWAKAGSSNQKLQVGVMENNTFVLVAETEGINTTYAEYTVFLNEYTGTGRNIAIKCGTHTNLINYYVDDLTVEVAPTCRLPKDFEADVKSDSEATLSWTAGGTETAWNIQYKKASDTEWSALIPVTTTMHVLTGLKRATEYIARVQANCNADDQSDWVETNFTTDCGVWPVDTQNSLFEDFENIEASDFPPICWEKFNHEMSSYSYWYLNSNNELGSSAAYSSFNSGYAFLVMPKMHINGDATLSFDYLIGSGTYDESCSVVVSTGAMTYAGFNQTIWAADGIYTPSVKANATISLSSYIGQDIYIAFKFKGSGSSGCTWYIDNVAVYVPVSLTIDIAGYGTNDGGYYLISSPVKNVNPVAANMVVSPAENYDLYRFNQSGANGEWENYKANNFTLEPGRGYLYASKNDVTLTFTGMMYDGDGQVPLEYDENATLKGWNLIGNPYLTHANVDRPYYMLNADGSEVYPETETV